jgi:hypothetical protein
MRQYAGEGFHDTRLSELNEVTRRVLCPHMIQCVAQRPKTKTKSLIRALYRMRMTSDLIHAGNPEEEPLRVHGHSRHESQTPERHCHPCCADRHVWFHLPHDRGHHSHSTICSVDTLSFRFSCSPARPRRMPWISDYSCFTKEGRHPRLCLEGSNFESRFILSRRTVLGIGIGAVYEAWVCTRSLVRTRTGSDGLGIIPDKVRPSNCSSNSECVMILIIL